MSVMHRESSTILKTLVQQLSNRTLSVLLHETSSYRPGQVPGSKNKDPFNNGCDCRVELWCCNDEQTCIDKACVYPTKQPSMDPTKEPSTNPTKHLSKNPTMNPSIQPKTHTDRSSTSRLSWWIWLIIVLIGFGVVICLLYFCVWFYGYCRNREYGRVRNNDDVELSDLEQMIAL